MTTKTLAKHYSVLTAEERFRLIFAAGARGDEIEQSRLKAAGEHIRLSVQDHAPFGHAFNDVAMRAYIELLDSSSLYTESFHHCDDGLETGEGEDSDSIRSLDTTLLFGFILRTKADGWQDFCEGMDLPPWDFWETLPGFGRLQSALAMTEKAAFTPEGFLRWRNRTAPVDGTEIAEHPLTAERIAKEYKQFFEQRAAWWGA